jgi:pyruvate,orthophosphate dikinase
MTNNLFFKFGSPIKADNNLHNNTLLGNKGLSLFDMSLIGVPVPPGFTISTELCKYYYQNNKSLPENFENELLREIEDLEKFSGKIFWWD